jgi:hypothetical protein
MRAWHWLTLASLVGLTSPAAAFWPCGWSIPPAEHTHERAGNPQCISKCAQPGRTCKYDVGYIGGGCHGGRGECRGEMDGTFGWDYVGCLCHKPARVFLNWCHCKDCQPERGPYKTDGPHVPDIFSLRPVKRCIENKKEKCDE